MVPELSCPFCGSEEVKSVGDPRDNVYRCLDDDCLRYFDEDEAASTTRIPNGRTRDE